MSLLSKLDSILDRRYEEAMDYIYLKYHTYHSPGGPTSLSGADEAAISAAAIQAGRAGDHQAAQALEGYKKVRFDHDPNWHNGMPRKR